MRSTYMIPTEKSFDFENLSEHFKPPILIVSTRVGRGMYSIGEAIQERQEDKPHVYHLAVEELLSGSAIKEDLERYQLICNRFPFLLYLVYKIPIFYYRKYLRERFFNSTDLQKLKRKIESLHIKTVICVSHRPAFWITNLKRRESVDVSVWGVLAEYGKNLGWKYQFWEQMDGFLSPVDEDKLDLQLPSHVKFFKINLPAKRAYYEISEARGDKNSVLLVCGIWGLGPFVKILQALVGELPSVRIHVVCGDNKQEYEKIRQVFKHNPNIHLYGMTPSLVPHLKECASVITKPGISSLLESHAARRQIFLLKGLPVAEDNNARFAIRHFGAQWFDIEAFKRWYAASSS